MLFCYQLEIFFCLSIRMNSHHFLLRHLIKYTRWTFDERFFFWDKLLITTYMRFFLTFVLRELPCSMIYLNPFPSLEEHKEQDHSSNDCVHSHEALTLQHHDLRGRGGIQGGLSWFSVLLSLESSHDIENYS